MTEKVTKIEKKKTTVNTGQLVHIGAEVAAFGAFGFYVYRENQKLALEIAQQKKLLSDVAQYVALLEQNLSKYINELVAVTKAHNESITNLVDRNNKLSKEVTTVKYDLEDATTPAYEPRYSRYENTSPNGRDARRPSSQNQDDYYQRSRGNGSGREEERYNNRGANRGSTPMHSGEHLPTNKKAPRTVDREDASERLKEAKKRIEEENQED